jgi:hypothetical protein
MQGRKYNKVNLIGNDKYFIRLISNPKMYMHFANQTEDEVTLNMREGLIGAAAFTEQNADQIITQYKNVEKILCIAVLPNDGSLN